MKNLKIPWHGLLLAAGVVHSAASVAQVVQVPSGCTVVLAGVGGTTGPFPTGFVGNGGIVCMPDPYAGGNFTFSGGAVISWSMAGDISEQTANVPPAAPDQSAGAVATVNLESYNKNLRDPSELSTPTLARSKGRVVIIWDNGPCDAVYFAFDILKSWTTPAPPIVGPNCWGTGLITFSVDQVSSDNALDAIGFDQYYWKITNNLGSDLITAFPTVSYTSADRSSITINQSLVDFTTWIGGGAPYTIQVCYGRCNPWDGGTALSRVGIGTTCVTKAMNPAAPIPAYTGGFLTCLNAVTPGTPIPVLSSNYNSSYTYTWTRSNLSWLFTPNGAGGLTINSIGDGNPCTFFLNLTGPCGSTTYSYTINRNYNSASMLALASPYCTSTGLFTVNLGALYQGNQTCWGALPAGWTATNVGSSGVQFNIPAAAAATTANINLFSCGACSAVTLPIVINVRPNTPVITGPACVPSGGGATQTFTSTAPCATCFAWGTNTGMTPFVPVNDSPQTYNPTGTASGTVTLYTFTTAAPTCSSLVATKIVNRNAVAPIVVQPACYNLGVPGSVSFTIQAANFTQNGAGTYTWTFPAGSFFQAGTVVQSTNAAVVRTTSGVIGSPSSFTVAFAPSSGCAGSSVVITPSTALGNATYSNNGTGPGTTGVLIAPGAPGGSTYQVFDCNTSILLGSPGASNVLPLNTVLPVGTGLLTTNIIVPGGCTWRPPCVITSHTLMPILPDGSIGVYENGELRISPNPNTGLFTLNILREVVEGSVLIFDAGGKQIGGSTRVAQGPNELSYNELVPGVYTLRITLDGKVETRQVMVSEQ